MTKDVFSANAESQKMDENSIIRIDGYTGPVPNIVEQNLLMPRVLGKFYPSKLDKWTIDAEYPAWVITNTGVTSLLQPANVRNPQDNKKIAMDRIGARERTQEAIQHNGNTRAKVADFHSDAYIHHYFMAVWSNREPTVFWGIPDFEPNDVIIADTAALHRSPWKISEDRWFARVFGPLNEYLSKL